MYYISEALAGAKICYSELEKMVYAMVMASQKLKHYLTTHPVTVPATFPIQEILVDSA